MGTRGIMAFHEGGTTKAAYTHWDAYPGGLGTTVLDFVRGRDLDELRGAVQGLTLVDNQTPPTPEQIEALSKYADTMVGDRDLSSWYVLLRGTQGDPEKTFESGYIENAFDFGYDSLFCEWAFVVDLDTGTFDAYVGFNKSDTAEGLWSSGKPSRNEYGSVTRVATWPLTDLPDNDDFVAKLEAEERA